ncbi:MAG: flagellar hook-length control protein FliK [Rhodocyclaceae bacterium]|nr:MAG: flagellar hook-length control protein FliK [Rhodocyclaceae bacterium]
MPEIAAAPSPVVASLNANASSATNANGVAPGTSATDNNGNSSAADPFAAMLQKLIKAQGKGTDATDLDSAKLALMLESQPDKAVAGQDGASAGDAMANLMLMLQSQMQGQQAIQNVAAASQGDSHDEGKDKKKDTAESDAPALDTNSVLAALTAPVVATPGNAKADTGHENTVSDGKTGHSLATEAAILARGEDAGSTTGAKAAKEGEETFQNLLDTARDVRHQGQANNVPIASQVARQENRIETPVGHQNWSQEVGDKLAWMVGKQESKVELVLNPPQMGRIEVSITMNGDQANATFGSANPAVREALESALPRLREVLADAGVRLDQAQVGGDSRGDSPQNQERRDNPGHNNKVVSGEFVPGLTPASSSSGQWIQRGNGMVDTFA